MCGAAGVLWLAMSCLGGAQESINRDRAVRLATAELARAIGVAESSVTLVDAVEAEWRDSSLGCPQRGTVYAQALTPGFRVTLRAGRSRYSVHVGAGRAVLCGTPLRGDARDGKIVRSDATAGLQLAEQARTHLAARLRMRPNQVVINFFRPTTWPDARLGCMAPTKPPNSVPTDTAPMDAAPPQPTRGFLIELSAGGTKYEYHADLTRVVACTSSP
jgi:hypothetical protein